MSAQKKRNIHFTKERRYTRHPLGTTNVNGEIAFNGSSRTIPFYVIDISEEGFGLWVPQPIEENEVVILRFNQLAFWDKVLGNDTSPRSEEFKLDLKKHGVETIGKVAWSTRSEDDFGCRIGVVVASVVKNSTGYNMIVSALQKDQEEDQDEQ
jgi:hypothetical protein